MNFKTSKNILRKQERPCPDNLWLELNLTASNPLSPTCIRDYVFDICNRRLKLA
jgi:hypothetical protein